MNVRRQRHRSSRVAAPTPWRGLARLVLLAILAAFTFRVSLAYTDPCTVHEASESTSVDSGAWDDCCAGGAAEAQAPVDDEGCSCPIDCHQGCAGTSIAALPMMFLSSPPYSGEVVDMANTRYEQRPPRPSRLDILHVPRSS